MVTLTRNVLSLLTAADRWKIGGLFVLMLAAALFEIAGLGLIVLFASALAAPERVFGMARIAPIASALGITDARGLLVWGSVFLIGLFACKNAFLILCTQLQTRFVYGQFRRIAGLLLRAYLSAPMEFYFGRNSTVLVHNVVYEVHLLVKHVMLSSLIIATEAALTLGVFAFLVMVEPVIALGALCFFGGTSVLFVRFFKKRLEAQGVLAVERREEMLRQAGDGMSVLREVGLRSRQEWFLRQFDMSARAFARAEVHDEVVRRSFKPLVETAAVAGMLLITLTLLWQGEDISAIVPVLALFGAAAFRLLPSFEKMINHYDQIQYRSAILMLVHDDITTLASERVRAEAAHITDEPIRFEHMISMENVGYVYPSSAAYALQGVSLTIKKGEAVGLVGPTGGGKTTMVDIITGLLEPAVGTVRVDGRDIREHLPSWQERIGYVPQHVYLADATIRENIALGIDAADIDEAMLQRAARMAQLEEFVDKLPLGLDTMVGERGVRLSGGQRQRIGIARALYADPEILIFDEATSALDTQTEAYVIEALERLKGDRTIVMIAHRLSTVRNCDRLVVLRDGAVSDIGTYQEIIERL